MTLPTLARLTILAALAAATPAMAQYQELTVKAEAVHPGPDYAWSVRVTADEVVLAGDVPYLSVKEALNGRAGETAIDRMGLAEGAPRGFLIDASTAIEASALLSDGAVTYADGVWTVTGQLRPDTDRAELEAVLGQRTAAGDPWRVEVEDEASEAVAEIVPDQPVDEPATGDAQPEDEADTAQQDSSAEQAIETERADEVEPQAVQSPAAEPVDAPATDTARATDGPSALDLCRERAAAYMADRSILFGSGSARLAAASEADLAGLVEILAVCPAAPVYVEGHTDADGGAEANLILSLSRAETVVDALIALGIDPQRLYAVGYGASLPVASNQTAAGKAQNRRIVFSFEDAAGTEGSEE